MPARLNSFKTIVLILTFFVVSVFSGFSDELLQKKLTGVIDPAPEELGLVTLVVDGTTVGDIEVIFTENKYFLSLQKLDSILVDYMAPGFHSEVFRTKLKAYRWVGSAELSAVGLSVMEDSNSLSFFLVVPPSKRPVNDIRISQTTYNSIKPILLPSPFSAILNTELQAGLDFSVSGSYVPISWLFDLSLNISDWILEANGRVSFYRDLTAALQMLRFVHDIGPLGARLYGGMVTSTSLGYQQSSSLYGLTLDSYNFVPGRRPANAPVSQFVLEKKSIVRIILNGTILLTLDLDPGTYDVGQFDFAPGINDFVIEIETPGEKKQRIHAVVSREDVLLGKDMVEFSASAGVGRTDLGEIFGSTFYRRGLADVLTAGGAVQFGKYSGLAGITAVYASPIGAITLNAANMLAWDGRLAQAANLKYKLTFPGRSSAPSFGLDFEIRTKDFEAPRIGTLPTYPEGTFSVTAQASGRLSSDSFIGISGTYSRQYTGTVQDTVSSSLSFSTNLRPGYSLLLSGGTSQTLGEALTATASIRLSINPQGGNQLFNFTQSLNGENSVSIANTGAENGIAASFQGDNLLGTSANPANVTISARKTTALADFAGNLDLQYGNAEVPGLSTQATLSASTGFVFVNGTFGMARRISDSFMIFAPPQTLSRERIDVRNDSGQTGSSIGGSVVVLPLTSYRSGLATLNLPESDPNIVLKTTTATVSPRYKSGIFFTTDIVRSHAISATLVDKAGAPLGYIMAEVFNEMGESVSSTFTDENGYFELYDLLGGIYTIRWPLDLGVTYFEIPEDSPKDLTLGTILPSVPGQEGPQ